MFLLPVTPFKSIEYWLSKLVMFKISKSVDKLYEISSNNISDINNETSRNDKGYLCRNR